MGAMILADVIGIKKPDPDSQWRLRICGKCKGDNVAYEHYDGKGGAAWRVKCFDCGHTVDKGHRVRHDAQTVWNKDTAREVSDYGKHIS